MKNQKLGQKNQYHGPVFDVESIKMQLPDGRSRVYDLVKIQNAVAILPVDADGSIYFVRQYRIGAGKEMLELPAGKIEEGEEALATAEREIREETGFAAKEIKSIGKFFMSPGYSTEFMVVYLATGLYPAPLAPDQDEFINLVRLSPLEVRQKIDSGEIEDGKTLASLYLALPFFDSHNQEHPWLKDSDNNG